MEIYLIGSGNVATHFGLLFKKAGHEITGVYSRTKKNAGLLGKKLRCRHTNDPEKIDRNSDFYFLCLSDDKLKSFIDELSFVPKNIVHTSGITPLDVFPKKFNSACVLYPVQTFSKNSPTPSRIPLCIEAKNKSTLMLIRKIASDISKEIYTVNSKERALIHLSAVFANNFTNHLYSIASELLAERKLSFKIIQPLIHETANKIQHSAAAELQTGPARRNDTKTINKHLKLLKGNRQLINIYKIISNNIIDQYH